MWQLSCCISCISRDSFELLVLALMTPCHHSQQCSALIHIPTTVVIMKEDSRSHQYQFNCSHVNDNQCIKMLFSPCFPRPGYSCKLSVCAMLPVPFPTLRCSLLHLIRQIIHVQCQYPLLTPNWTQPGSGQKPALFLDFKKPLLSGMPNANFLFLIYLLHTTHYITING